MEPGSPAMQADCHMIQQFDSYIPQRSKTEDSTTHLPQLFMTTLFMIAKGLNNSEICHQGKDNQNGVCVHGCVCTCIWTIKRSADTCASMDKTRNQGGISGKEWACQAGGIRDLGAIPGLRRSPGGGHGNPLQYSCLESPMGREAWRAIVGLICLPSRDSVY